MDMFQRGGSTNLNHQPDKDLRQDSSLGHLRAGHGASAPSAPRGSAIGGIAGLTAVATVGLAVSSRSAKAGRSPWFSVALGDFFLGKMKKNGETWRNMGVSP